MRYFLIFILLASTASANMSNDVMKSCLENNGYTPEKFETYDFTKAAACHSKWRVADKNKQTVKMREFLDENPWFKGTNWKWKQRAEYKCNNVATNAGWVEVCHRPYYVN